MGKEKCVSRQEYGQPFFNIKDTVQCPYEKSHRINKAKIQIHLIKCRKSHPNIVKTTCPFNATHLVDAEDLPVCMDKINIYFTAE